MSLTGTGADPVMVERVLEAERRRVRDDRQLRKDGLLWRYLLKPGNLEVPPASDRIRRAEELRKTARAAVEDWLEACP